MSVWSAATPIRSRSIPVMERIKSFFKMLLRMICAHAEIFFTALFPVFVWHSHLFQYLVQLTSAAEAVDSDRRIRPIGEINLHPGIILFSLIYDALQCERTRGIRQPEIETILSCQSQEEKLLSIDIIFPVIRHLQSAVS